MARWSRDFQGRELADPYEGVWTDVFGSWVTATVTGRPRASEVRDGAVRLVLTHGLVVASSDGRRYQTVMDVAEHLGTPFRRRRWRSGGFWVIDTSFSSAGEVAIAVHSERTDEPTEVVAVTDPSLSQLTVLASNPAHVRKALAVAWPMETQPTV